MAEPLWGQLTEVPDILVGHAERIGAGWLTGVTVVLPPPGTVGAVDVRGGGPGTHETDALDPTTLVPTVDAVALAGGSAFGLVAARGVQRWCEEHGRGFAAGPPSDPTSLLVPIVPAAAIFDLGRGADTSVDTPSGRPDEARLVSGRPDQAMGYSAAQAAGAGLTRARSTTTGDPAVGARDAAGDAGAADAAVAVGPARPVRRGAVGAGTGARMARQTLRGGVGTASIRLPDGVVVGALVVVNALGSPFDQVTGTLLGSAFIPPGLPRPTAERLSTPATATRQRVDGQSSPANTTLAVVATNAILDPARARRTATAAHDGIARGLSPAHTLLDGDTVFCLATGQIPVDLPALIRLQAAAADAVLLAILDAVLTAANLPLP